MNDVPYYDPRADWSLIPGHMRSGVELYVMRGIPGGSFMTAVMENDLMGAAGRADSSNSARLGDWAMFVYNYTPSQCHGSPEKVTAWIERGGIVGRGES